jgi:tRNA threonylcarbamoyladenosine biosynthesis protein TsaB
VDEKVMLAVETSSLRGSVALGRAVAAGGSPAGAGHPTEDGRRAVGRYVGHGGPTLQPTADSGVGRYAAPRCRSGSDPTADREVGRDTAPANGVVWRALSAERKNAAELLPAICELLAEIGAEPGDVGVVCFSQGPGSFTGLRVAATLARMWQSATGCRVVAVPTLEVVARNALALADTPARLAVIVDARRGQVYGAVFERLHNAHCSRAAAYDADELRTVADAGLYDAATWLGGLEKPCGVLGEGVAKHRPEVIAAGLEILPEETWWPDAREVLAIGWRLAAEGRFCSPEEILPAYLRPPECEEVYEQRRAEAQARHGM